MRKQDVLTEIRLAFSDVTLGEGIGLWEAQAIDDYQTKEIQNKNREKDEKEDWSALSFDDLQRCHSSLSFFDAAGMRFHLPAFIIASVDNKVNDPVYHLTQLDDYAKSKLTALNQAQRKSIVSYLNWCLGQEDYVFEHPAIRMALSEYWEN